MKIKFDCRFASHQSDEECVLYFLCNLHTLTVFHASHSYFWQSANGERPATLWLRLRV